MNKLKPCTCSDAEGITECGECGGILYTSTTDPREQAQLIKKLGKALEFFMNPPGHEKIIYCKALKEYREWRKKQNG